MNVRCAPHATKRLFERFGGRPDWLKEMIRWVVDGNGLEPAPAGRWIVHGVINGRAVEVVYAEDAVGDCTVITVMWVK